MMKVGDSASVKPLKEKFYFQSSQREYLVVFLTGAFFKKVCSLRAGGRKSSAREKVRLEWEKVFVELMVAECVLNVFAINLCSGHVGPTCFSSCSKRTWNQLDFLFVL